MTHAAYARVCARAGEPLNLRYDMPFITKLCENVIAFGGWCGCAFLMPISGNDCTVTTDVNR